MWLFVIPVMFLALSLPGSDRRNKYTFYTEVDQLNGQGPIAPTKNNPASAFESNTLLPSKRILPRIMSQIIDTPSSNRSPSPKILTDVPKDIDDPTSKHPTLTKLFTDEEISDIFFVIDFLSHITETGIPSREALIEYTRSKGFTPYELRRGNSATGHRREIRIREAGSDGRIVREYYSAYFEHEEQLLFDQFLYGLDQREYLYDIIVFQLNEVIGDKAILVEISKLFAKWHFEDGTFIFINPSYSFKGDLNDKLILIAKGWELH